MYIYITRLLVPIGCSGLSECITAVVRMWKSHVGMCHFEHILIVFLLLFIGGRFFAFSVEQFGQVKVVADNHARVAGNFVQELPRTVIIICLFIDFFVQEQNFLIHFIKIYFLFRIKIGQIWVIYISTGELYGLRRLMLTRSPRCSNKLSMP